MNSKSILHRGLDYCLYTTSQADADSANFLNENHLFNICFKVTEAEALRYDIFLKVSMIK